MVPMVQVTQKPLKLIAVKDPPWTYLKKTKTKHLSFLHLHVGIPERDLGASNKTSIKHFMPDFNGHYDYLPESVKNLQLSKL